MLLKNFDTRDVFPQKHGNAYVYPHEKTKWQGNAVVFPAPITIALGNLYVLQTCFLCFLKTEIRSRFFCSFCQKLFAIRDQKLRKRHAAGNTELSKSHDSCKKYKNAKKDTKDIT